MPTGAKFEYHLVELVGLCRECTQRFATKGRSASHSMGPSVKARP
jgi:hypothetical protein